MIRLGPEEQRICPVCRSRVATELGPEHNSVISFPVSFSRIPKQMASQMKSPCCVRFTERPVSTWATQREGLRFCQQLRVYSSIKLGMNDRAVRTSRTLGAAEFCKPCQQQETLKTASTFANNGILQMVLGSAHPVGLCKKHRLQQTPEFSSTLS